ncbi:UNC93-like protein isoform X2 [Anticarsia gemmatalis]|uniref:UNC93-like protein isoform X2 n=1 Tax=Anticarsia gemmatalis TaxID=129554 RepID=UPI003F76133D
MALEKFEFESEVEPLKSDETWKIRKNVVFLALAFMLHFTAYSGAANLQSSINSESGLGTASLAAVYAGLVFSNIFLPVAVIKWLGTKWTVSLMFFTYMPYIAAQLYPRFYTMIPAGLFLGLGGGPLWCAQGTYLATAADAQSKFTKTPAKELLVRFLGLFFMVYQTNQIWGNLISSLVLSSGNNTAAATNVNETMIPILCGANFLPDSNEIKAIPSQPAEKMQMIAGIYLACMVGASVLVAIAVDPMKRDGYNKGSGGGQSGFALLAVTMRHCAQPTQLLLLILNIYIGLHQAFFSADFTASFVSCAIGTGSVGFVMMMYGFSDAVGCLLTGYLAKAVGRLPLILCALVMHGGVFVMLLSWRPHVGDDYVMFIIAMLWGLCDSIWTVQITGYYGTLFAGKEEAAFSSYRLFEAVGYIIAYSISPYLRTMYKVHLLIAMMLVGVCGYFTVEYQQYRKGKVEAVKEEVPMMKGG